MVEQDLINALNDCIDALGQGLTIDQAVRRHPEYATALRPMLEAGLTVRKAQSTPFEVTASKDRGRVRFQAALAANRRRKRRSDGWLRIASLLLVVGGLLAGTGLAAESSLPGDPLYGFKLFTESLRAGLSDSQAEMFASSRRREEIRQLQALGREAEVEFRGIIVGKAGELWDVSSILTRVLPGTPGAEAAGVGDTVIVEVLITDGGQTVLAQQISVVFDQPDAPTPTVTPTTSAAACALPAGWVSYSVRSGDTLSLLAAATNSTVDALAEANCIENARFISVGQSIYLPSIPIFAASATPQPAPPQIAPTFEPASESGSNPPPVQGENTPQIEDDDPPQEEEDDVPPPEEGDDEPED